MHLFHVDDNILRSTLLLSSAVHIQLYFSNHKLSVKTHAICPKFEGQDITASSCYSCTVLDLITFRALSTCDPGVVTVDFQDSNVHTKAIRLMTEDKTFHVQFFAVSQCYNEYLCLKSTTIIQCQTLKLYLDEPSVELL